MVLNKGNNATGTGYKKNNKYISNSGVPKNNIRSSMYVPQEVCTTLYFTDIGTVE